MAACDHAAFGNESAAIKELQVAVVLRPGDSNVLYNAACVCALFQRKEEALEMLRKAMQAGYHNLNWIARGPELACLQDEPQFRRLLEEVKPKN